MGEGVKKMKKNKVQHGFIYREVTGKHAIPDDAIQIRNDVNKAFGREENYESRMIRIDSNVVSKRGNVFKNKRYSTDIDSHLN